MQEKEYGWMREREDDSEVSRPLVQREQIYAAVRPTSHWAVAQRHQYPQEQVRCHGTHGAEAKIGTKIEHSHLGCLS
jgi:hypothetical protein